jgi:hypothetical protein
VGFISSLPQLGWDKRLSCCCCCYRTAHWILKFLVLAVYEQDRNKFVDCISDLVVLDEINIDGSLNISKE